MVDKSPAQDKLLQREVRVWEPKEHRPTLTWSRSGYKPYSTYVEVLISRHGSANSNTESRTSTLRGRPLLRHASRDSVSFVSIVYIKSNQWFESAANSIDRKLVNHVAPFLAPGNMDLRHLTRTAQGWPRMAHLRLCKVCLFSIVFAKDEIMVQGRSDRYSSSQQNCAFQEFGHQSKCFAS